MDMICHRINEVSLNTKDICGYCRGLNDTFHNIVVVCGIQTRIVNLVVIGTNCIGSYKSNYHI